MALRLNGASPSDRGGPHAATGDESGGDKPVTHGGRRAPKPFLPSPAITMRRAVCGPGLSGRDGRRLRRTLPGGGPGSSISSTPSASRSSLSLTDGGVTAGVGWDAENSKASLSIKKGSTVWTDSPPAADVQGPPDFSLDTRKWAALTRINAASGSETERFRVVAQVKSSADLNEDYVACGYWNRVPLDSLDDYKPFYCGKAPYTGNVADVTSAFRLFCGGATGVYRLGMGNAVGGRFTSNVRMTMQFGVEPTFTLLIAYQAHPEPAEVPERRSPGIAGILARAAVGRSFTLAGWRPALP